MWALLCVGHPQTPDAHPVVGGPALVLTRLNPQHVFEEADRLWEARAESDVAGVLLGSSRLICYPTGLG